MSDETNECKPSYDKDPPSLSSLKAKLDDIKRTNKRKHMDGRPLRPLSAYNIFFQMERGRIMQEQSDPNAKHVVKGFGTLASTVAAKWKEIDTSLKLDLETMAHLDKMRYDREKEEWKLSMLKQAKEDEEASKAPSEEKTVRYKSDDGNIPFTTYPISIISEGRTDICGDNNPFPHLPILTVPRGQDYLCHPCSMNSDDVRPPFVEKAVGPGDRPMPYHAPTSQDIVSTIRFPPRPITNILEDKFSENDNCPFKNVNEDRCTLKSDSFQVPSLNAAMKDHISTYRHGSTFMSNSSQVIPNANEHCSDYMRGYVEGFKVAARMWETH